ncbi:hypothetical protein ABIA33_005634 [Streptacidiphilus sp. MAP12-16]|uniref:MAE_28990/MAE_18760 family HEPN-like nuclease n=1 Tax=Streptacidiphilus sp. MAP12-16 TaxID=3156300 RepID=UPI003513FF4F
MNIVELRAELENDLSWRLDELRHLRNTLLAGDSADQWSATAMRTILVMQYAHLEGFTRNAFSVYVNAINEKSLKANELQPQLMASALTAEFEAMRKNVSTDEEKEEDGRLTRRAKNQVIFVQKLQEVSSAPVEIVAEIAASMEMNLGRDVLRRCLYMLAIPSSQVSGQQFNAIEFVKNARNDIAHGSRRESISPRMFESHRAKCEQFMNDLIRLVTSAVSNEWFKLGAVVVD